MKQCTIKQVERLARRFLKHPPHKSWIDLNKCRIAFDKCYEVSEAFQRYLRRNGCESEVIAAEGFLGKVPNRAHPAYRGKFYDDDNVKPFTRSQFNHGMVKVGDYAIDLTGAQFNPRWAGIRIVHMGKIQKEWRRVQTEDEKWAKKWGTY